MSDRSRIAALATKIAQIEQEIDYWRRHEQEVAAQLDMAMLSLRQYTSVGRLPEHSVSVAVNNHSTALNQIRNTLTTLHNRKAVAESQQRDLMRRLGNGH
ncbi:hypothetical protein NHJ13051_003057 [Beauveria bassiana]|uniref:Uncharacterized protein n=1 Tax=Beauveria bassiana TaxID=176275 RepID=A0A2N6NLH8_BEABA|nr:hypothetical protein BM221_006304 [Beauveria bassiana]